MFQFNKSLATNTNAAYIAVPNLSASYYDNLIITYSQSYDNSSGTINVTTTSAPTQYTNWLVITNNGAQVPAPSGQYNIEVYINSSSSLSGIWDQADTAWELYNETWDRAGSSGPSNTLIYADRAFVSGSNEENITQYVSPNENGTYITYNG